jgi:thiamine kinase-like enzyme
MPFKNEIDAILVTHNLRFESLLNNGLSNIVVRALDAENNPVAVKYYPRDTFKREREQRFIELAHDQYPTPEIVAVGEDHLVTRFVPGESGSSLFSQPQDHSATAGRTIGAHAARLHSMPLADMHIGFLTLGDTSSAEYDSIPSSIRSNTQFLRTLIDEQLRHLEAHDLPLQHIDAQSLSVTEDDECVPLHHDICPKNVLFENGSVTTFLDFEYAMAGSRLFDIAKVHVLAKYLPYHTGGRARFIDDDAYLTGFEGGYGRSFSFDELRPFFIYVLLNYILFWVSNPIADNNDRDMILPIHLSNLERIIAGQDIVVPPYPA